MEILQLSEEVGMLKRDKAKIHQSKPPLTTSESMMAKTNLHKEQIALKQ